MFTAYLLAVVAALVLAVIAPGPFADFLRTTGGWVLNVLREMARGLPKPFPI